MRTHGKRSSEEPKRLSRVGPVTDAWAVAWEGAHIANGAPFATFCLAGAKMA